MKQSIKDESRVADPLDAARRWAASKLGGIEHELRVERIALSLAAATAPLHRLSSHQRRLLRLATLVHDVGRSKGRRNHAIVGAQMVRDADDLPLDATDRRHVAFLTRFHRGTAPGASSLPGLKRDEEFDDLRLVLAFLRAADALDSRSIAPPMLATVLRARRLRVRIYLAEESGKARRVFSRLKKFRLLEQVLGVTVDVSMRAPGKPVTA